MLALSVIAFGVYLLGAVSISIIYVILGVIFGLACGYVCGRICVDIIRNKDDRQNVVMWFWLGFLFDIIAILLTLVVKNQNKDN